MHTIQIPDALWDAYNGSPTRMRDELMAGALRAASTPANGDGQQLSLGEPEPTQRPGFGTLFTAGRHSWCPTDGTEINPGDRAVMMDYHEPGTGRIRGAAFCVPCAEQRGWEAPA